jgi:hypothetical protein
VSASKIRTGGPFTARIRLEANDAKGYHDVLSAVEERACSAREHLEWWVEACDAELAATNAQPPFEHPSREWYLWQIAGHAETALGAADSCNWWGAIDMAMRFSRLLKEFEIREYQLRTGQRGGEERARSKNAKNAERDAAIRKDFADRRAKAAKTISNRAIIEKIAKERGLGRTTVFDILTNKISIGVGAKPNT